MLCPGSSASSETFDSEYLAGPRASADSCSSYHKFFAFRFTLSEGRGVPASGLRIEGLGSELGVGLGFRV